MVRITMELKGLMSKYINNILLQLIYSVIYKSDTLTLIHTILIIQYYNNHSEQLYTLRIYYYS